MIKIWTQCLGDLCCEIRHEPSGTDITTDARVDNEGRSESFSPTDLAVTSLGTCMLTILGIAARRHEVDPGKTTVKVMKEMTPQPPRRIAKLTVLFTIPLPAEHPHRTLLENAARSCPVRLSLHSEVTQEMCFDWVGGGSMRAVSDIRPFFGCWLRGVTMNPHARKVLIRNTAFVRTQGLDFSYWVTIAAQDNRKPLILNRARQFGKMSFGFVNANCFHDY